MQSLTAQNLSCHFSKIADFFYQDNRNIILIRRLVGLLIIVQCLFGALCIYQAQPYLIPAWRHGSHFFHLPELPHSICMGLWVICAICGLFLMYGKTSKFFLVIPVVLTAFVGTCEYTCIICNFFNLTWLYAIALLFYREPRGCTRRIIQLSVAICYFFAALSKLDPEWLNGSTMYEIVAHGWWVRQQLAFITHLGISHEWTQFFAIGAACLELFLAGALFFKRTRKIGFLAGIFLHTAITVFFDGVDFFMVTMFVGYLAFVDNRQQNENIPQHPIPLREAIALACLLIFIIWMPARFYFLSDIPFRYTSATDRMPWGYAMFLFDEQLKEVSAKFIDNDGYERSEPLVGRMSQAINNSDIYALTDYVHRCHPQSPQVFVTIKETINEHWTITKLCSIVSDNHGSQCQLFITSQRPDSTWQGLARGSAKNIVK